MQPGVEARGYVKIMRPEVEAERRSAKVVEEPVWVSRGPPKVLREVSCLPTLVGERGVVAKSRVDAVAVVAAVGAAVVDEVSILPVSGGFSRSSVAGGRDSSPVESAGAAGSVVAGAAGVVVVAAAEVSAVAAGAAVLDPARPMVFALDRIAFPSAVVVLGSVVAVPESAVAVVASVVASCAVTGAGAGTDAAAALLAPAPTFFAFPRPFFPSAAVTLGTVAAAPDELASAVLVSAAGTVVVLGAVPAVSGIIPVSPVSTAAPAGSS